MRTGKNAKRAVVVIAIVKMKTKRQHIVKQGRWGLNVRNAGLYRPRAEAFDIDPTLHGDRGILMPRYFPVGVRCFVEKRWRERVGRRGRELVRRGIEGRRNGRAIESPAIAVCFTARACPRACRPRSLRRRFPVRPTVRICWALSQHSRRSHNRRAGYLACKLPRRELVTRGDQPGGLCGSDLCSLIAWEMERSADRYPSIPSATAPVPISFL